MKSYITEVMAKQLANEIPIHIYEFTVEDPTKKYEGVYKIYKAWQRANHYMPMGYNQSTIVSFQPVQHFIGYNPINYQHKTLNTENLFERSLLERLIKDSFLAAGQQNLKLKRVGSDLQEWNAKTIGNVLMYPALSFHVNIVNNRICIGFNMTHKFEYNYTLQQMIERGIVLEEGMKIIHSDIKNNYTYEFEKVADYSVKDICLILKKSIYQYYVDKGDMKAAETLHSGIKVIYAKAQNQNSLSYAANFLKPLCSFETMKPNETKQVMDALKLKPNERMKKMLRQMINLIEVFPYLQFERNPFLIEHNDYQMRTIQDPKVYLDKPYIKSLHGLKNGKLYKGGTIKLSIFMDEAFEKKLGISKTVAFKFIRIMQNIAFQHGVVIEINTATNETKGKFTEEFFREFAWQIRSLESIFKDTTVLAFITEEHLTKLPIKIYSEFKRQFGGKWDISSQVLTEKSLRAFERLLQQHKIEAFNPNDEAACSHVANIVKNSPMSFTMFNILLGIYVKSGMQPWILAERTYSDCFIGLDVSHEDGKSAAGIMNVIGCNGHLIKQSAINGVLAGEKIDSETLKEILVDVLHAYQQQFGEFPKHVTIHRDGRWREDSVLVEQLLTGKNIAYDIVEIIKQPNRRMAFYDETADNGKGKFLTRQGVYYVRDKEAFLCATDPRENIGMAQPIKIIQQTATLPFHQIVEDVYRLSFMHIHALNKMRLPATIHYADLSSTAYQRGQIAARSTNVTHLPFV
ncbi:Piwi domain-containing protein [Lysinibacillus sp. LZ02]|uniref:Piwi domain-containing protein n=1 Tax=Lysinibacillus sp. LZ02 TaxID=3420668 RepID=UPI003D367C95